MECTNLNKEEQGCEGAGGTVGATVLRDGGGREGRSERIVGSLFTGSSVPFFVSFRSLFPPSNQTLTACSRRSTKSFLGKGLRSAETASTYSHSLQLLKNLRP
jgi:hypothetical protein